MKVTITQRTEQTERPRTGCMWEVVRGVTTYTYEDGALVSVTTGRYIHRPPVLVVMGLDPDNDWSALDEKPVQPVCVGTRLVGMIR